MPPPPVKILTGLYSDGYSLSATYTNLTVRASASVAGTAGLTGAYAATGEVGGVGLTVGFSATTHNAGHISGGVGGEGGYGGYAIGGGGGGVGGVGAVQVSGVMVNTGVVVGGVGGVGGSTSGSRIGAGGQGGIGLYVADGDFTNRGVVVGGAGGQGGHGGYNSHGSGGTGGLGVELHGGGRLTNLGTIAGGAGGSNGDISYAQQGFGVAAYGASIVNGSATVTSATIAGTLAVEDLLGVITNFGTLSGVYVGSASLGGATYNLGLIEGGTIGAATVFGGIVVNGDHANHSATIDGQIGFYAATYYGGGATLVNFGQISGSGGTAVFFQTAYDRLVVEVGSTLDGVALGGGGTLEFGTGQGHVSGFGTQYSGFGAYWVDTGGVWRVAGSNTMVGDLSVAAGGGLNVGGGHIPARTGTPAPSLMVEGAIANDGVLSAVGGALIVEGAVTGAGKLVINGGFAQFDSTFSQRVRFGAGGGELVLAHSQDFAGHVFNFAPGGAEFDLKDIGFVSSSEATFKAYARGGVLTVSDGTHTARIHLNGDFTGAVWKVSSDGGGGVLVDDLPPGASAPAVASAMASLGGGGGATATAAVDPSRHLLPQMLTVPGR